MKRSSITRLALFIAIVVCAMLVVALPAMADATYHTEHIALMPTDDAPLKVGFVQNIHANGPQVFALERYVLVGAVPDTTYQVTLQLRLDPEGAVIASLPTTTFTTNGVGNGVGDVALPPSAAEGLHGATLYIIWELSAGGVVLYQTVMTTVTLD